MRRWINAGWVLATQAPMPALAAASALGWLLLVVQPAGDAFTMPFCGSAWAVDRLASEIKLATALVDPGRWATGWVVMLLAMTPPLLGAPVTRLWRGSLARRRATVLLSFALGYLAVWILVGTGLQVLAIGLGAMAGAPAVTLVGVVWAAWRLSPLWRRAELGCHRAPQLRVFGTAAWTDSFDYGLRFGGWCAAACWPLMLAPLVAGRGHWVMMLIAAAMMAIDRNLPRDDEDLPNTGLRRA